MRAAAVFDLDGTLLRGRSSESLLVSYLLRRRVIGGRQLAAALPTALTFPVAGRTAALRRNKRYLAGLDPSAVRDHVRDFIRDVLEPRFNQLVADRLMALRAEGYIVCLLTGAPDVIAEAVRRRFAMTDAIGTGLEVRNGLYTGRIRGSHYFGEAKRRGVEDLARKHAIDLRRSIAFADHASDVAFLKPFGHAVAVEPQSALRREAERRGWEVL